MPDPHPLITVICDTYRSLSSLAPAVAMLIIASALFLGIVTKYVAMGAMMLAVLMAVLIASFPYVLSALGVTVGCP